MFNGHDLKQTALGIQAAPARAGTEIVFRVAKHAAVATVFPFSF